MIEGLERVLEDSGQRGVKELRGLLQELLGGRDATGRLLEEQMLQPRAMRVFRFANRIIWPAIALVMDRAAWGAEALVEINGWFEQFESVLPGRWNLSAYSSASGQPLPVVAVAKGARAVAGNFHGAVALEVIEEALQDAP